MSRGLIFSHSSKKLITSENLGVFSFFLREQNRNEGKFYFLIADKQLFKWLCPSVCWSISPSDHGDQVEKWENEHSRYFVCIFMCVEVGVEV